MVNTTSKLEEYPWETLWPLHTVAYSWVNLNRNLSNQMQTKIKLWVRYIDDILILWSGSQLEFQTFLLNCNKLHPTIKFSGECSPNEIHFLDATIYKGTNFQNKHTLDTKTYTKPTNKQTYVHSSSFHPKGTGKSIVLGEAYRFLRTNTDESNFRQQILKLQKALLARFFPLLPKPVPEHFQVLISKDTARNKASQTYSTYNAYWPKAYMDPTDFFTTPHNKKQSAVNTLSEFTTIQQNEKETQTNITYNKHKQTIYHCRTCPVFEFGFDHRDTNKYLCSSTQLDSSADEETKTVESTDGRGGSISLEEETTRMALLLGSISKCRKSEALSVVEKHQLLSKRRSSS